MVVVSFCRSSPGSLSSLLGAAGQGEGPSVSAAELPKGAGSYPGSSGTNTCKLWSVCELLLLLHHLTSPEHRWAFTSPRAVELQLLGKINISNFGAPGQSECALLGISPSGSVSPPPGKVTGSGLGSVLGRWGSPSSAEDEQVTGLPAPPAAEAGSPTAAQRLSCSQALLEPTPHGVKLPLHQEQGQTTLLQLHLHSKNVRVLQNARGCRKHATTACHSTAEGTLYKAAPAYAWLPQPLGIPKAGKKILRQPQKINTEGRLAPAAQSCSSCGSADL